MAGGYAWSRRVMARVRTLRALVNDTQHALHDCGVNILSIEPEIHSVVREIGHQSSRATALVVLGSNSKARARLLHCLLGRQLLPEDMPRGCRWVRIQHGSSTQVHLSLGNSEFELVEELECNQRPWDVLPAKDLIRQDVAELTTILEVEINNQFLKDGLCIIIPPDIATDPGTSNHLQLKNTHSEFYAKRSCILKNFNCVYLYGVDKTGKNIFSDNVCGDINMAMSYDEDFWDTYNLYTGGSRTNGGDGGDGDKNGDEGVTWSASEAGEPAVFSPENCLDLHQIKDINPNSQLLFLLFSDATEPDARDVTVPGARDVTDAAWYACSDEMPEADRGMRNSKVRNRQTSSSPDPKQTCDSAKQRLIQEQVSFMNELIEQWELMSCRPRKHYVKSQWVILDDGELMRTADLKHAPAYIAHAHSASETCVKGRQYDRLIRSRNVLLSAVVKFGTEAMQSYLLEYCTRLSEVHIKQLQRLILASFSLARELQVVPRRVQYVAQHEHQLFQTINEKFSQGDKKQELLEIMQEVIQDMKADIYNMDWSVDQLPCHQDRRFAISNSLFYSSTQSSAYASLPLSTLPTPWYREGGAHEPPSDGEDATLYDSCNLEEYDIIGRCEESYNECSNDTSGGDDSSPSTDILVENETEMFSLSTARWSLRDVTCSSSGVSHKHATHDVQQTVLSRLSRKISLKLVKFFGCLKESYFGTLQRCLESLETSCRHELGGKPASEAMRQLLSVGRQVQLQPGAASSLMTSLLDNLRRLFNKLRIVGGEDEEACCALSPVWRRRVAIQFTQSLSPHRLARIISTQIIERLSEAHERYQSALAALESALACRLHHTEDVKLAIRKVHAPAFAKLCLESTSMCDLLMYGTPELGREIGRGQYGVVYSVRGGWGGHAPVAVKSVLPADERHYRELAMEFFYTRSIPPHPRIVRLHGSVVSRTEAGRCVLLVSARKVRDLHAAVRAGLPHRTRMMIAADIVEGIRYLHSLGLVHRDIKLKNVLLDGSCRAALSDLGFCAAGALMSGSVVGTPVHMAPELGAGPYAASVDVYAFGILFWYLCAGDVRLPAAFEVFNNKQQLWSKVKKGCRPERLAHFTDECWNLMESCWHADPDRRALLGDVHLQLQAILQQPDADDNTPYVQRDTDEDSLNFTGVHAWNA